MRITGHPDYLFTMYGNANSSTLSTIKRRAEKDILPCEVVYYPNGLGSRCRAFWLNPHSSCALFRYADWEIDTLGTPLFGDVAAIQKWLDEQGLQIASRTITD